MAPHDLRDARIERIEVEPPVQGDRASHAAHTAPLAELVQPPMRQLGICERGQDEERAASAR